MFSSNQVLEISGDNYTDLKTAIEFLVKYDDHQSIDCIRGIKEEDGYLCFGTIPCLDYVNVSTNEYSKNYDDKICKEYDTTFTSDLVPVTSDLLVSVIKNWLHSAAVDEKYKELADKNDCRFWDTPTRGWKLTAIADEVACDRKKPSETLFIVEPFWTEYTD